MNNTGYVVTYGEQDYWESPVCITVNSSIANQIIIDLNKFFKEAGKIADRDWHGDGLYPSAELSSFIASASNKLKRKYGVDFSIFDVNLPNYLLDSPKAWFYETVVVPVGRNAVAAMAIS